jgi:hypothetical protein
MSFEELKIPNNLKFRYIYTKIKRERGKNSSEEKETGE